MKPSREEAEAAIRTLLLWAGEDPDRPGLLETPKRVIKAYEEFFAGYKLDAYDILDRVFENVQEKEEAILVRDIEFYSHCEHHMVPIIGKAHICYIPDHALVGLSKLGRLVDVYAKRFQTQEALTENIINAIMQYLQPKGAAILLEGQHMCMAMRGIKKQCSNTITKAFRGCYINNNNLQQDFFNMLKI